MSIPYRLVAIAVALVAPVGLHAADSPKSRSLFDDDWTPPPARVAADPKRMPAQPQTAPTDATVKRRPIPAKDAQATVRAAMKEVYGDQIADRSIAARRKLSATLLAKAEKSGDAPADQFVLLAAAVDSAVEAVDLAAADAAADRMGATFAIDALAVKVDAAVRMGPKSGVKANAADNVAAAVAAADELIRANDPASATRICTAMQPAAVTPDLRTELQEKRREIAAVKESADRVAPSLAALEKSPDDPAANLAAGRHFCFFIRDWERGNAYLAKGSDDALKTAAKRELDGGSTPDAALGVGDGWWDLAASQTDKTARAAMMAHAADVYSGALDRLSGLRKSQIEKRVADARGGGGGAAASRAKAAVKPVELLATMNGNVSGRDRGTVMLKLGDRITTPEKYKPPVAFRVVTQTEGIDFRIAYAADQIIFNWANNPTELRIDGGPANARYKPGAGNVPRNAWVAIDLIVTPNSMTIAVDGQERQKVDADFSNVNQTFSIWPSTSPIKVKSIQVMTPKD